MKRGSPQEVRPKDLRKRLPTNYFIISVSKPSRKIRAGRLPAVPGAVPLADISAGMTLGARIRKWGRKNIAALAAAISLLPLAAPAQTPAAAVPTTGPAV
ncbi:hypothetical protein, partial [Hymenobacter agri]